jgi:hypothetical protein
MIPQEQTAVALYQWVERTRQQDTPGFFDKVQDILRLSEAGASPATDLAFVILRDPVLTTRLLQVANGFYADAFSNPISSVSRAIVLLGFNAVRRVAISLWLIEEYLRGPTREHLAQELARSFHAAIQARALAQLIRDPDAEEVAIAALLQGLGSIVFWSSGDHATVELDRALRGYARKDEGGEPSVLGLDPRQLNQRLNHELQVGQLLDEVLGGRGAPERRMSCARAGREIAVAVENGWSSEALQQLVASLAAEFQLEPQALMRRVRESAIKAADVAATYGAGQLGALIPRPNRA